MRTMIKSAVFSLLMFSLQHTYAASFDCLQAKTLTEKAVCNHLEINDADVKMATTYKIVTRLFPMGTRSAIQEEQARWLEFRNRCDASAKCLREVYAMRQQKLDQYLQRVYQQGPF